MNNFFGETLKELGIPETPKNIKALWKLWGNGYIVGKPPPSKEEIMAYKDVPLEDSFEVTGLA